MLYYDLFATIGGAHIINKLIAAIAATIFVLSLAACGTAPASPKLHIDKAQLTQQEQDITELLGSNNGQLIYDFVLDSTVKSLQVNTYKLVNSSWEFISGGGGQQFTDAKGRLALDFDHLSAGLRVALQSEHSGGSNSYDSNLALDFAGMGTLTSTLDNLTEITYEQEIPLVMQLSTSADTISSGNLDSFFTPADLAGKGYEHVYAVTIRFSQQTVAELAG